MADSVEQYLEKHADWEPQIRELRELLLDVGLQETIKWGAPAYTLAGKNVIGIAAFKNHCALWFHQGAFLKENNALLHDPGKDGAKAMRQIRFGKGQEIKPELLRDYVLEAMQNQREGKVIKPTRGKPLEVPAELVAVLKDDPALKRSFEDLTPGKQREYADYISQARKEPTRLRRLEKIRPMIKDGQGLHDKYRPS